MQGVPAGVCSRRVGVNGNDTGAGVTIRNGVWFTGVVPDPVDSRG